MFLVRLRRGAKWAFVLLVFAFGFGFLFAGVGGSSGGDIIQQLLGMRGGSDPIKSEENTVKEHPRDMTARVTLAQLLWNKNRQGDAIRTYETILKLQPKNLDAITALRNIWGTRANDRWTEYQAALMQLQSAYELQGSVGSPGVSANPVQALTGSTSSDPLLSAYTNSFSTKASSAQAALLKAGKPWERVSRLAVQATPKSDKAALAPAVLQLAQAASTADDLKTAISSYKEYLRLSPHSQDAAQVRQALAAAEKAAASG